jgi:hypothetical protein
LSSGIPADAPVLAAAPLRPGFSRDSLSRYGDDSWDLGPAVFRENARRCHVTAHFCAVPDPAVARCLREYLYARLNIDLPGCQPPLAPASLRQSFNRARRFFEFIRAELGGCDLARVDQGLLDRTAPRRDEKPYRQLRQRARRRRPTQASHFADLEAESERPRLTFCMQISRVASISPQ